MTNWQRTILLNPEWGQAQDGDYPVRDLARLISENLTALAPLGNAEVDDERDELAWRFGDLAKDTVLTDDELTREFDAAMSDLYDWGDTPLDNKLWQGKKVCWIDTISQPCAAAASS
jgi:hypothetical protein